MPVSNKELVEALLRPIEDALEDQGLTIEYLCKKLKYELEYIEPRIGLRGRPKPGPKAMRIRQTARQDAHKLRGDYAAEKHVFPDKHGEPQDISGLSNLELATKLINLALERKKAANDDSSSTD